MKSGPITRERLGPYSTDDYRAQVNLEDKRAVACLYNFIADHNAAEANLWRNFKADEIAAHYIANFKRKVSSPGERWRFEAWLKAKCGQDQALFEELLEWSRSL